jgi:hypothetical protein
MPVAHLASVGLGKLGKLLPQLLDDSNVTAFLILVRLTLSLQGRQQPL